jgi:hypothetical protein
MASGLLKIVNERNLQITIYVIIGLLIFEELIRLTTFVYKFNSYYDYGRMLKNVCGTNYTEFETDRFQIAANIDDIKIPDTNYELFFYIFCVTVTFGICIIFLYTYLLATTNIDIWNNFTLDQFKKIFTDPNTTSVVIFTKICALILAIYIIILIPVFVGKPDLSPYINPDATNISTYTGLAASIFILLLSGIYYNINNTQSIFISLFTFAMFVVFYYFVSMIQTKYWKYPDIENKDNTDKDKSIIMEFLQKLFYKTHNSILYELLIFLASLFAVYLIVAIFIWFFINGGEEDYNINTYKLFSRDDTTNVFRYSIVPVLSMIAINLVVNANKNHNRYINHYILEKPEYQYRHHITKLNNIFNQILQNDEATIENASICRNMANAVHLVVYSSIFRSVPQDLMFVPEFNYTSSCNNDQHYIEYAKIREYEFNYYMKHHKDAMFFNKDNCKSVKNNILIDVMLNIKNKFDKKPNIKTILNIAFKNIFAGRSYYSEKILLTSGKKSELNKIITDDTEDQMKTGMQEIADRVLKKKLDILADEINNMYNAYIDDVYKSMLVTLRTLCGCNSIKDITSGSLNDNEVRNTINANNNTFSINIKKDFINQIFVKKTQALFIDINEKLTTQITTDGKHHKLTKVIIANFNNLQTEDEVKYYKDKFYKTDNTSYKDPLQNIYETFANVKDFDKILDNFDDTFANNIMTLRKYLLAYISSKNTNGDYYLERIYDQKVKYMEAVIKECENESKKTIVNRLTKESNEVLANTLKEYNIAIENILKSATKSKLKSEQFAKIQIADTQDNKKITQSAQDASNTIYALVSIYVLALVLAIMIKINLSPNSNRI